MPTTGMDRMPGSGLARGTLFDKELNVTNIDVPDIVVRSSLIFEKDGEDRITISWTSPSNNKNVYIRSMDAGNDYFVFEAATQTLTNKTISGGTATALTDLDMTAGNKTILDTIGANTLTIAAGGTTVSIPGNLTVSGTTTTVNTTTLNVADNMFLMNSDFTGSATQDSGLVIERGDDTNVAIVWDESADQFVMVTTNNAGAGNDVTAISYANLQVGTLTGSVTGNTSGAVTASSLTLNGDVTTAAALDWDLVDNNASALSFDASGAAGILVIDTQNGSERVTMSGDLLVSGDLTVTGTTTSVDTVTMNANNALAFEGTSADSVETILTVVDPTSADKTITLPNLTGHVSLFDATSTTLITSTPAEINLIDGGTSRGTTAVASGDGILINDGGVMRMTNVDTVSTYFASHTVGGGNLVTTGPLDSGSITSNFGSINVGSSAITTTGTVTAGDLNVTGTTTTVSTANLAIEDSLMSIAAEQTTGTNTDAVDVGFYSPYRVSGGTRYRGLFYDLSTTRWKFFNRSGNSDEVPGTSNIVNTTSGFALGNLEAGDITGTLRTVAQTYITSLGTLSIVNVDNIRIDGNTISSTAGTDLLITPLAGQQIVLDGTIIIDAGVVTGATSITSTAFVGNIDGILGANTPAAITATTIGSGAITSTGTSSFGTGSTIGNLTLANGSITDSSGAITFVNENLVTTGTLGSGAFTSSGLITGTDLEISGTSTTIGTVTSGIWNAGAVTSSGGITSTAASNTFGATSFNEASITNVGTISADYFQGDTDSNTFISMTGSDIIGFTSNGAERMRVLGANTLVGYTASIGQADGETGLLQVHGVDSRGSLGLTRWSDDSGSGGIWIAKSRGATVGATHGGGTAVNSGDELGRIIFSADDSTNILTPGVKIGAYAEADGTTNDIEANLRFHTNSGSAAVTERMRIAADGKVGIGSTAPKADLHVRSGNAANDGQAFGSKDIVLTDAYDSTAQLAITMSNYQACYVKVFITGNWATGTHYAVAYLGEFFVQRTNNAGNEPGAIIRQIDNTHSGSMSAQIVDVDGSSSGAFLIRFKTSTSEGGETAYLNYHIMGQFDSIV